MAITPSQKSGAIIEYILLRYGHGRLQPDPASSSYNEFIYWMHYPEGSALPTLSMRDIAANLAGAGSSLLQALDAEIADHLSHLDSALDGRPYILGDEFSAADIQLSFLGELAGCKVGISPICQCGPLGRALSGAFSLQGGDRSRRRL